MNIIGKAKKVYDRYLYHAVKHTKLSSLTSGINLYTHLTPQEGKICTDIIYVGLFPQKCLVLQTDSFDTFPTSSTQKFNI